MVKKGCMDFVVEGVRPEVNQREHERNWRGMKSLKLSKEDAWFG